MSATAVQILKLLAQADVADLKKAGDALDDVDRKADKAEGSTSKLGAAFTKVGQAGKVATQLGVLAVGAAMFESTRRAADFQQSLANVGSVTGATADDLAALRQEALNVGRDTSKSASESVLAFGELLKAGMSVQDVVGGAGRTVVQLAEATGTSVESMAVLLSNSLNTFGLGADQSAAVANTLARAANASAIDVSDLGQSLQAVGPVAKQAGLTMDDFATAMGIMGNHALKGSDAGTSLKTMLLALTAPTDKAKNLMHEYGIEVFDAEGNTRDFRSILGDLQTSLGDLSDEEKSGVLKDIFGSDAIRAANILLEEGVQGWDKFGEAMGKAPSVAEMSTARLNTLQGKIEQLKGSLETMAIMIGEKALPPLMRLADGALKVAEHLMKMDWQGILAPGVAFLTEKVKPAIEEAIAVAMRIVDTVRDNWPAIRDTAVAVFDAVISRVSGIAEEIRPTVEAIVHHFTWLVDEIKERWDRLEPIIRPVIEFVVTFVSEQLDILSNIIQGVMNLIQGDWSGAWENVKEIALSLWEQIKALIELQIKLIPAILNLGFDLIKDAAQLGWEAVKKLAELAWDAIKRIVTEKQDDVIELVKGLPGQIKAGAASFATALRGIGGDLIEGMIDGVKAAAGRLKDAALGAVGDALNAVKDKFGIRSPSDWTNEEIGQPLAEGVGEGWSEALAGYDFVSALKDRLVAARAELMAASADAGDASGLAFYEAWRNRLVADRAATGQGSAAPGSTPGTSNGVIFTGPETGWAFIDGAWQQITSTALQARAAVADMAVAAAAAAPALMATAAAAAEAAYASAAQISGPRQRMDSPGGTGSGFYQELRNYAGVAGLTMGTGSDEFGPFNSPGFSADILAAYGSIEALLDEYERRAGRFKDVPRNDAGGLITRPSFLVDINSGVPYGMVAERRPELLMGGAATAAHLSSGGDSGNVTAYIQIDGRTFAELTFDARQLVDGARMEARMVG